MRIGCLTLIANFVAGYHVADRCTMMLVGAKSSETGSPITTHTADCVICDFRIAKVPRQQHVAGSMRNIPLLRQYYPRYVGRDRGAPEYYKENLPDKVYNWNDTLIIGQIPQVESTYGYIDGIYPIINEHQLAIGESTCGARFYAKPATQGGKALFDITELARVAFERTKTARDAIKLMGNLAEKYGYYGAAWEGDAEDLKGESGEALTVTDPKEGWVFHILPDDTGASAVWIAQRVPDNHIIAVGNQFIIHQVNLNDTDNFLGSSNLYEVAKRNKLWDGETPFDFTAVYANKFDDSKLATRRQWRVFTLANPNLKLSPFTDSFGTDYPFSVETAGILSIADIIRFQRDHYEGTPFDLTQGFAAGPYGSPDRYSIGRLHNPPTTGVRNTFERPISYHTTSYSYITQLHPTNVNNALVWFGPYVPHATSYMPIYAKVSSVPDVTSRGSLLRFDFNSSFWINALIGNYAGHYYKHAMPAVAAVQLDIEKRAAEALAEVQATAAKILATQGEAAFVQHLTASSNKFATVAHDAFRSLFEDVVTRFHDGSIFSNFSSETMSVTAMGYPLWWLEEVGYFGNVSSGFAWTGVVVLGIIVGVGASVGLGYWLGKRSVKQKGYVFVK